MTTAIATKEQALIRGDAPYDETQEEPNFTLVIECYREPEAKYAHAVWHADGRIEGGSFIDNLTRTRRDYISTVVNHIGTRIQMQLTNGEDRAEQAITIAKSMRTRARLADQHYAEAVADMVYFHGVQTTCSVLHLKKRQVMALVKAGAKITDNPKGLKAS